MAEEYNGYYNYNVWNIMLWINNTRELYDRKIEIFKEYHKGKISYKVFKTRLGRLASGTKLNYSDIKKDKFTKKEKAEVVKDLVSEYRNDYKPYWDKEGY